MKVYNVDLDRRTGLVEVPVEHDGLPLEAFIANLRQAAGGLTNPTVEVNTEQDFDVLTAEVCVYGERFLTDEEIEEYQRRFAPPDRVAQTVNLVQAMGADEKERLAEKLRAHPNLLKITGQQ